MRCLQCGSDSPADAEFCPECGTRLGIVCGRCGASNAAGYRFCKKCGQPLAGAAPEPRDPRFATPRAYTPKHLAERILTSRAALEGELKQVTVLFCDLASSTALAERLGPEAMHALLNRFFELSLEAVHRYEGTINQFLGDGFMALFGAPLAHEDDARRAVLACLGIQRSLAEHRGELGQPPGVDVAVRIGLNTGLVVVATIGDNLRMDYTAVGDTTNLAARLQQHAEPGTILVSDATRRLIEDHVRLEPIEPVQVKGKKAPVPAYRVVGLEARRSPLESRSARGLSRFVGRDRELAALADVLAQAEAGHGQVVGIVGDPGVGKSRLLYEFRERSRGRRLTWVEGRCLSYGGAIPYLPLLDMLRDRFAIADGDRPEVIAGKVRRGLHEIGLDAEQAGYLFRLLGVKDDDTGRFDMLSPEAIKADTFEALRQVLLLSARRQPVICVVEDLHWVDAISDELLTSLVESIAGVPILLVTSYRPGHRPPWLEKSYATQLALRPLSADDSLSVVRSIGRHADLPEAVARLILDKAEGNPFFLEELTRAVLEPGGLEPAAAMPDTIHGVLAARIDRLPEDLKRVLQTASVLGRSFSFRLLDEVWGEGEGLEAQLQRLIHLEFLQERSTADEVVYAFKHALTQEVAYASLLTPRREALHAAAGQALETLYHDRLEEYYELLAYHYARSANAEKALTYLGLANQKAARANAVVEAEASFTEAMKLLDALPDTEDNRERRISLLTNQAVVMSRLLKAQEYYGLLTRFEPVAVGLGASTLLGAFYTRMGWCEWSFGQFDQAVRTLTKAAEICGAGYAEAAWCHVFTGDYDRVLALKDLAVRGARHPRNLRSYAWAFAAASWAHAFRGQWEEALAEARRALQLGEEFSDSGVVSYATLTLSLACNHRGDSARAVEYAEAAVREAPTPADRLWSQTALAWAWCRAGEPRRGVEALAAQLLAYRAARYVPAVIFTTLWLGEGYWRVNEAAPAAAAFAESLELAERHGVRFVSGSAHRFLGEIALATDPAQAAPHLERGLAILEALKAENELALARAAHGRLLVGQGRVGEGRRHLARALETLERLGTLAEPDRVRRELDRLPVE